MIDQFFHYLIQIDNFYWSYIGLFILLITGVYLTIRTGFYQFRVLEHLPTTLKNLFQASQKDMPGLSPFRLYFASVGGSVGLGNIVAVVTALLIGGPGALFWLWVAALCGMLIKYSEIYLGMKYRIRNEHGGFDGGPMYTLRYAFKGRLGIILSYMAAFLLCIYGVEVFQFTVIVDTLVQTTSWNREVVIAILLLFMVYIGLGGVRRLANFSSICMPIFIVLYIFMCSWVIVLNAAALPGIFVEVFKSAFMGHAAMGGFAGSTLLMAAQQGAAQGVYSGDIAIGFDAIVQSETKVTDPQQQARLAIISIGTDSLICTLSILVVLVTGLWYTDTQLQTSEYVAKGLSMYFPHVDKSIVLIIFLAGFTTIQAYMVVGLKSAHFISQKFGRWLYFLYAVLGFWFFAHFDQDKVLVLMNLSGGLLILLNLSSILKLRKEINFHFKDV